MSQTIAPAHLDPYIGSLHTPLPQSRSAPPSPQILDDIVRDAFVTISRLDEQGLTLQTNLIKHEVEIREKILQELAETKAASSTTLLERIIRVVKEALLPASLLAAGTMAIFTGGTSLIAYAAVAAGSLFFLEAVFDNPIQHTVASWLGQGSHEDAQAWFERIHIFAQIVQFVISLGVAPGQAAQIARQVSEVAVESAKAGVEWKKNTQRALMTELRGALGSSDTQLAAYEASVQLFAQNLFSIQERLLSFQRSQKQVTASIMSLD